jgi:formate C-acetyltransferase
MCWVALHLENPNVGLSLGRLDQVLYPLYRQDVASGNLTREKAVELLCCLWLKIGDHVPTIADAGEQLFGGTGSNQAITVGGVDQEGKDAVNELTYAILRATELMKLRDPNLNARYYHGVNSQEYLRRLCEVNMETGATPALHNDRAVIKALTAKGESEQQARDYGIIGCVEPCSSGRTYSHSGAILLNLTAVLELTLFNGRHRHTGTVLISEETGDPTEFKSFEDFQHAFAQQVSWMAERTTTLNNLLGRVHQDFYPTPILSAFFEGPLDKGRDVIQGGATINASGVTIIGLADVADSISAIRKVVFEDRELPFAELRKALEANLEGKGYEALQRRLMDPQQTPKYGNEDALADGTVLWLTELLDQEFGKRENYRGGKYRVGYWTMTNHAGYARLTKALPSGRKSYENFASGITPVSGVTPYLPQTLNSVARVPARYLSNGVALNLKFTPEEDKERMLDAFVGYVRGYFGDVEERDHGRENTADRPGRREDVVGHRDGGMEIQFNIMTHDTLVEAAQYPEKYPELLVRVSGYTAYFKDLNPRMQKEIIDRTEYRLLAGGAVPYQPFPLPPQGS